MKDVDVLGHLDYPSCSEITYYWKPFFKKMYYVLPMLFNTNFKCSDTKRKVYNHSVNLVPTQVFMFTKKRVRL